MIHDTESLGNSAKTGTQKRAEFEPAQLVHAIGLCVHYAIMMSRPRVARTEGGRLCGETPGPDTRHPIAGAMMPLKRVEGPR